MDAPQKTEPSFKDIFSGTAYIDPNDFDDLGYTFLPVALAVFPKVVVYSPYPDSYDKAIMATAAQESDDTSPPIGLTWREFESIAAQKSKSLRVVGRTGYLDKPIIKETTSRCFRDSVEILDNQEWEANAETALSEFEALDRDDLIHRRGDPPLRYKRLLDGQVEFKPLAEPASGGRTRLPPTWKRKWDGLTDPERLFLLALYDCLNDHVPIRKLEATRPFLSMDALFANTPLLKLSPFHPVVEIFAEVPHEDALRLFANVLRVVLPVFGSPRTGGITLDTIQRFGKDEQEVFWRGTDELLQVLKGQPRNQQLATAKDWAEARERAIRLPGQLLITLVPFLFASWLAGPLAGGSVGIAGMTKGGVGYNLVGNIEALRRMGYKYCDSPIDRFLRPITTKPVRDLIKHIRGAFRGEG